MGIVLIIIYFMKEMAQIHTASDGPSPGRGKLTRTQPSMLARWKTLQVLSMIMAGLFLVLIEPT